MRFEWDDEKARANVAKHGIDFENAIRIFEGPTLEDEDRRRNYGETRMWAVGALGTLIVTVIYTERGEICRIISARKASRHEKEAYRQSQRG